MTTTSMTACTEPNNDFADEVPTVVLENPTPEETAWGQVMRTRTTRNIRKGATVSALPSMTAGVLAELAEAACSRKYDHSDLEVAQLGQVVLQLTDELASVREELRAVTADRSALMLQQAFTSAHRCADRIASDLGHANDGDDEHWFADVKRPSRTAVAFDILRKCGAL